MVSTEQWRARRVAQFYGPERVGLLRAERLAFVRRRVADIELERDRYVTQRDEEHQRECAECRAGEFCLWQFEVDPKQSEFSDYLGFLRSIVRDEERDAEYAAKARDYGVNYEHHIDGFCSYWQNVRYRKFVSVGWKCERCGVAGGLECHHPDYGILGFEEVADLTALCRRCHQAMPSSWR
jgi:hypothetical protein